MRGFVYASYEHPQSLDFGVRTTSLAATRILSAVVRKGVRRLTRSRGRGGDCADTRLETFPPRKGVARTAA
jgi:hypothetical protein